MENQNRILGEKISDLSEDEVGRIEELIRKQGGKLGPGCCIFEAKGIIWRISNVGDEATCRKIVTEWRGELTSYTPGRNCSR
jgi:hypothetical protein